MILEKHMARLVVRDRKTQLRTPVVPDRQFGGHRRCPYAAGEVYPVRFMLTLRDKSTERALASRWFHAPYGTWSASSTLRTLEARAKLLADSPTRRYVTVGYVRVVEVRRELLHEVAAVDVLAMGYSGRDELFDDWRAKYNTGPLAHPAVWVVTFERTEAPPRLLQAIGLGNDDYTRSPEREVDDAGEPVDDRSQHKITDEARLNAGQMASINQARREQYELEQRLERVREEAEVRGVDISSPLRVIERQLVKIERRVHEGKAA